jgi:hypothetical protein
VAASHCTFSCNKIFQPVDVSFLLPPIWVLLRLDGLLFLLPMEVLEGWDCLGGERQLVLQKDLQYILFPYTVYTRALSTRLSWFLFQIVVCHPLCLHLNPLLQSYFTLKFSSQVIFFFSLWDRGSGFLSFILFFKSIISIYIPTTFNTLRSYHMLN